MAKKEFTYRGKTLEELQAMDEKTFAQLIPSRSRRTLLRGKSRQEESLYEKLAKGKSPKTHARDSVITPQMIGKTIKIHNGKEYTAIEIQPEMIGQFLGEFAPTRKKVGHSSPGVGATKSSAGPAK